MLSLPWKQNNQSVQTRYFITYRIMNKLQHRCPLLSCMRNLLLDRSQLRFPYQPICKLCPFLPTFSHFSETILYTCTHTQNHSSGRSRVMKYVMYHNLQWCLLTTAEYTVHFHYWCTAIHSSGRDDFENETCNEAVIKHLQCLYLLSCHKEFSYIFVPNAKILIQTSLQMNCRGPILY